MSYLAQSQLGNDPQFQGRSRAAAQQQADIFIDDQRPAFVSTAKAVLLDGAPVATFWILNAAGPGIADKVDLGDGTIDQSKVTDADLLSLTQANWQVVAGLYFTEDGTPI
jgi:hypothetical protein